MYIAVIVAISLVAGLSGINQAEAVSNSTTTKTYISCDTNNPRISFDTVKATWGVWEQDDRLTSQYFNLAYTFPQTIYELKNNSCEPLKELVEINILVQGEDQYDYSVETCYNRAIVLELDDPPVDEDNPLTNNVDGFPSTNGIVEIKCKYNFNLFDIGNDQFVGVRAIYDNQETGKNEVIELNNYITVRN